MHMTFGDAVALVAIIVVALWVYDNWFDEES